MAMDGTNLKSNWHTESYNNIFCQVSYLNFEFSSLQCKKMCEKKESKKVQKIMVERDQLKRDERWRGGHGEGLNL